VMRAVFVLAVIAAAALAESQAKFEFIPGKNLTNASANFVFRWQKGMMWDFPASPNPLITFPEKAFLWTSGSVDASITPSSALATANAMVSFAVPPSASLLPMAALGYGVGEAAAKAQAASIVSGMLMGQGAGVFQAGLVGISALALSEVKPDGTSAGNVIGLRGACTPEEIKEGDIAGLTCTQTHDACNVTVTFVTSAQAGILKYAANPVSPRSMEMILDVNGFPLKDEQNHVRLDIALIIAEGEGELKGNASIKKIEGEDVYAGVSTQFVSENGIYEADVNVVSGLPGVDILTNATFRSIFGSNFTGKIAHIDFPAGAKNFVYDPAVGSGSNVYEALPPDVELSSSSAAPQPEPEPVEPDAASSAALSLLVALVCALIMF